MHVSAFKFKPLLMLFMAATLYGLSISNSLATESSLPPLPLNGYDRGAKALSRGDYPTAFKQFAMEAERGNVKGQAMLGILFSSGHGTPPNPLQAYKWLLIAQQRAGDESGSLKEKINNYIKDISPKLSKEQQDRAQLLAKEHIEVRGW